MKKFKVSLLDKKLWTNYAKFASVSSVIVSLVLAFVDFEQCIKYIIGGCYIGTLLMVFAIYYLMANFKNSAKFRINNSTVNVFYGDIFKQEELKVIAFNEYFDTIVDDKIISHASLNGQYLTDHITNIDQLDLDIDADERLKDQIVDTNEKRRRGKKIKYKLGSIHLHGNYILLAFSHFDEDNRARLTLQEYTDCLMNMWNEIDVIYSGKTVSIPLLGNGVTRFKDCEVNEQELLEIILWTYRISKVKFTYPACLNIVLHEGIRDKINLYRLKGEHE